MSQLATVGTRALKRPCINDDADETRERHSNLKKHWGVIYEMLQLGVWRNRTRTTEKQWQTLRREQRLVQRQRLLMQYILLFTHDNQRFWHGLQMRWFIKWRTKCEGKMQLLSGRLNNEASTSAALQPFQRLPSCQFCISYFLPFSSSTSSSSFWSIASSLSCGNTLEWAARFVMELQLLELLSQSFDDQWCVPHHAHHKQNRTADAGRQNKGVSVRLCSNAR